MNITPESILERSVNMARLVNSARRHLLEDQADAIATSSMLDGGGGSGISDPTPRLSVLLAPFTAHERAIQSALLGISKAYDHAERVVSMAISDKAPADTEPRCPGWNTELRARLGGCGEHLETYRLTNGKHQIRGTGLCMKCRKASEREQRDREDAA